MSAVIISPSAVIASPLPPKVAIPTLAPTAGLPRSRTRAISRSAVAIAWLGGGARQQQPEFVGADPRRQVVGPRLLPQRRRDRLQQAVAGLVAERVVDDVEGVDVEQQQRARPFAVERVEDPLFHRFHEAVSVVETAAVDRLSHCPSSGARKVCRENDCTKNWVERVNHYLTGRRQPVPARRMSAILRRSLALRPGVFLL